MSALAQARPVRPQASTRAARVAWYRQPIFWLGDLDDGADRIALLADAVEIGLEDGDRLRIGGKERIVLGLHEIPVPIGPVDVLGPHGDQRAAHHQTGHDHSG